MRRRDHGVAAARNVAADALNGDIPVAQRHARTRLDLEVVQRVTLRLGELPDLPLRELDVATNRRIDLPHQLRNRS